MAANELSVPDEAAGARDAQELFRGWIIDQRFVCTLFPEAFEDPTGWGILLADAAHHIANALAEARGEDRAEVLRRIREVFDTEIDRPTDTHSGRFVGVRPLSDEERAVANRATGFLTASMGERGRAALDGMPALWLATASFALGAVRALAEPTGLDEPRVVAVALDVYTQLGLAAPDAAEYAQHLLGDEQAPPIRAMIDEGERAATEWESAGGEVPEVLGEYLSQMQRMASDR